MTLLIASSTEDRQGPPLKQRVRPAGREHLAFPSHLVTDARPSVGRDAVCFEERAELGSVLPAEALSECGEDVAGGEQCMEQGLHTGRWNGPYPRVLAVTENSFDTGAEVSAFDNDIALGIKRGLEKPGTVSILDVAQDNMRGGQSASLDFLYSRIGK